MKNKKIWIGGGCIIVVCLCVFGLFGKLLWSWTFTPIYTSLEKAFYPELNVQMVLNLGEVDEGYFRADGKRFLIRGEGRYEYDCFPCDASPEEYLWGSDGQEIATLSAADGQKIEAVSFSPDGKFISAKGLNTARRWDENGHWLDTFSIPVVDHSWPDIHFSPDGKQWVVSDEYDNHSEIWTGDWQLVHTLNDTQVLTYSPDGRYLIGKQIPSNGPGPYGHDFDITLFDTQNNFAPKQIVTYRTFADLRLAPDGQHFITFGCTDGWAFEAGYFYCDGGKASLWDKDGNFVADLKGHAKVTQVAFVPNSDKIITAGCDGYVKQLSILPTPECLSSSLRLHDTSGATISILRDEIGDFWISPDGKSLITADGKSLITNIPKPGDNGKVWRFRP